MSDAIAAVGRAFVGDDTNNSARQIQTASTQSQHVVLHEDQVVQAIGLMGSDEQRQMITDISRRITQLRALRIGETHVGSA